MSWPGGGDWLAGGASGRSGRNERGGRPDSLRGLGGSWVGHPVEHPAKGVAHDGAENEGPEVGQETLHACLPDRPEIGVICLQTEISGDSDPGRILIGKDFRESLETLNLLVVGSTPTRPTKSTTCKMPT